MAATITKGYTFGATELVTNVKLHTLVDSATISGIVNAEVSASAGIVFSKLSATAANIGTNASIISTAGARIVNLYACSAGSISTITGMLTNIPFMLVQRSSGASLALIDASPFYLNGNANLNAIGSNITLVWDGTSYIELGRVDP